MKKVLNIIGYISLTVIPYFLAKFIFVFYDFVKISVLIVLFIVICFQIIHYRKTKIKNFGIRIFITIILIVACSYIICYGYGMIKNIEAQNLAKTIEKISFGNYEIKENQIENNLKFVNTKDLIYKGSSDAIIYYKDGKKEKTKVYVPPFYVIEIRNNKYFINEMNFEF